MRGERGLATAAVVSVVTASHHPPGIIRACVRVCKSCIQVKQWPRPSARVLRTRVRECPPALSTAPAAGRNGSRRAGAHRQSDPRARQTGWRRGGKGRASSLASLRLDIPFASPSVYPFFPRWPPHPSPSSLPPTILSPLCLPPGLSLLSHSKRRTSKGTSKEGWRVRSAHKTVTAGFSCRHLIRASCASCLLLRSKRPLGRTLPPLSQQRQTAASVRASGRGTKSAAYSDHCLVTLRFTPALKPLRCLLPRRPFVLSRKDA